MNYSAAMLGTAMLLIYPRVYAEEQYFNPLFLGQDASLIQDLSFLNQGNELVPGDYYLDIYIGDKLVHNINVTFSNNNENKITPCITENTVKLLPLNKVTQELLKQYSNDNCVDIKQVIPELDYKVNLSNLSLTLVIPQMYLESVSSTLAKESDWNDGINGFLINYNFLGNQAYNSQGDDSSSYYFSLENKLNIGAWRFHNNMYWNQNKSGDFSNNEFKTTGTYLTRDIKSLKSTFLIGESSIGSNLFDALQYKGATLASSNEMRPESENGYAPPIKGIATTRSRITIRQNNLIIYQTFVDPGPYDIKNLYPVGASGDYQVEVATLDGAILEEYIVPYATLPNLLKEKGYNYSATVGRLDMQDVEKNEFLQGAFSYGLPFKSTIYAGIQGYKDYHAVGLGLAKDFGHLGAFSLDVVHANTQLINEDRTSTGQSYRFLFAKSFLKTNTNIQLTGYRYSTDGYYTLNEALYHNKDNDGFNTYLHGRKRSTFQLNVNQNFGNWGQLYVWGVTTTYWGEEGNSNNIQVGWNKSFPQLNNLNAAFNYNMQKFNDYENNTVGLTFSMPLTFGKSRNNASYLSNSSFYSEQSGDFTNNTSVFGRSDDNKYTYNLNQSFSNGEQEDITSGNIRYSTDFAELSVGTSLSNSVQQVDVGVSGSILGHDKRLSLFQKSYDTSILVDAIGATGADVYRAGENIKVNKQGYALIPYATPYRYNDVELSSDSFNSNFDIDNKIVKVVPTRGAIVKAKFDVRSGYSFLITPQYNAQTIKFGTIVESLDEKSTAIANDDGTVYLTGVKDSSKFRVFWSKDETCEFSVQYDNSIDQNVINRLSVECIGVPHE